MTSPTKFVEIDGFFVEITEASVPASASRLDWLHRTSADQDDLVSEPAGGSADAVIERMHQLRWVIARVCTQVRDSFPDATRPDELKVSFGIKLGGEIGIPFVSRGTGDASIVVEATWKKAQ